MKIFLENLGIKRVGETGVTSSWHVFQKNAHKTQESLLSGMSDVPSEKVDIYDCYQFKV